jgi:hypothetical protein
VLDAEIDAFNNLIAAQCGGTSIDRDDPDRIHELHTDRPPIAP